MGGATLGHALARAGKQVLFCERGRSHLASPEAITGDYPEQCLPRSVVEGEVEWRSLMQRGGRYVDRVIDESGSDYLFPASLFATVTLRGKARLAVLSAI